MLLTTLFNLVKFISSVLPFLYCSGILTLLYDLLFCDSLKCQILTLFNLVLFRGLNVVPNKDVVKAMVSSQHPWSGGGALAQEPGRGWKLLGQALQGKSWRLHPISKTEVNTLDHRCCILLKLTKYL